MSIEHSPARSRDKLTGQYDEYLTEDQLALKMHVSTRTLQRHRQEGTGIPFVRFGRRVLYRWSTAAAYVEANTFSSTSEAAERGQ